MERGGGRARAGFLAGLAAAVLLGGCAQRAEEPASGQIFAMDTIMSMDVYGEGGEEALARAEETIYRLEDLWAVTDEDSEIWALNHSGGAWVDLSQETADLLAQALELCALTDGALDLTAYSAVQAWGFTTGEYRVPSQEELDALIPLIDYTRLELDGDGLRARLPENMELDLGAVAKGYTGACLAEQLRQAGVTSAILRLGGNIQVWGTGPTETPGGWPFRTRTASRRPPWGWWRCPTRRSSPRGAISGTLRRAERPTGTSWTRTPPLPPAAA